MAHVARKSDHGTEESLCRGLFICTAAPFFCLLCCIVPQKEEFVSNEASMDNSQSGSSTKKQNPAAILFVAAFAVFLATFNETLLNVGFAPIMEALDVNVSTVQWLATVYMLGAAVIVPVSAFAYRSSRRVRFFARPQHFW